MKGALAFALRMRLGAPALLAMLSVASCEQPHVDVPVRPAKDDDDDDDDDEGMRLRCSDASTCRDTRPECFQGFCVECFLDEHCPDGQTCEPGDWECDSPG
jgi:Cys-rich repeat protein